MEEIIRFVTLAQTDRFTITDLCEQFWDQPQDANTCALLDIVHARRRRELGSILGGALRRLVPHYSGYFSTPTPARHAEDARHAA